MRASSHRGQPAPLMIEDRSLHSGSVKRYSVLSNLGKGGFAVVYRVESKDSHRIYAIKVVDKSKLTSSEHKKKLVSEIKLHSSLEHKHVVRFERYFEDKQNVYILLECCANGSLMRLSMKRKTLTEHEVRFFTKQLLIGLQYLHAQFIIHRDLKLGNILLDENLNIKICDFGLAAKLQYGSERKTTICGTPNYTAPEILNQRRSGEGHSYEVDIWSIGVILFTLLTGTPPFETRNIKETYRRIRKIKYEFPANSDEYISQPSKQLVAQIFTMDPNQRPSLTAIANHPFFTQSRIPKLLPPCIMTRTPSYNELFPATAADSNDNAPKSMSLSSSSSSSLPSCDSSPKATLGAAKQTLPLKRNSNSNSNRNSSGGSSSGDGGRPPLVSTGYNNAFKSHAAYPSRPRSVPLAEPSFPSRNVADENSTNGVKNAKNDKMSTEPMTEQSQCVLSIIKYVDYRKKYGFGYVLSNGCTGIYFNDCTKILLLEDKQNVLYIDQHEARQFCSLHSFPPTLKKKVTLLNHFCEYLWRTVPPPTSTAASDDNDAAQAQNYDTINALMQELKSRMKLCRTENVVLDENRVYLKSIVSDQYCLLFKFSNSLVQVNFTDFSQIIIMHKQSKVQYRDKTGSVNIYAMKTAFDSSKKDLKKRCKYTQQLLQKMAGKKNNNRNDQ